VRAGGDVKRLPATHDLDGFIDTLELLLKHARIGRLVAVSINLDPSGLGHYGYKLLDGTAPDIADPIEWDNTPATAPGKKKP
jgi:hypothetical protein